MVTDRCDWRGQLRCAAGRGPTGLFISQGGGKLNFAPALAPATNQGILETLRRRGANALAQMRIITVSGRQGKVPNELKIDAIVTDTPSMAGGMGSVIGFDKSWFASRDPAGRG